MRWKCGMRRRSDGMKMLAISVCFLYNSISTKRLIFGYGGEMMDLEVRTGQDIVLRTE